MNPIQHAQSSRKTAKAAKCNQNGVQRVWNARSACTLPGKGVECACMPNDDLTSVAGGDGRGVTEGMARQH